MQASHSTSYKDEGDEECNDTEFAMKFCLLTDQNTTMHQSNMDSSYIYLTNAAKSMGINVDTEKEKYIDSKSFRSQYPVNEFTTGEFGLVAAFPHIFMFGKAYKKHVSNLKQKDCIHLLMQFCSAAAQCRTLLFYLFDIQRRHSNIKGMSARRHANPEAFDELAQEISSPSFHMKVQNAVADPGCKDAKYVLRKLIPVLTTAGKHTSYGALERNSALGENYALIRRFGPELTFLTVAIDDVSCPHVFRLSFNQPNNFQFPSKASKNFLDCMKFGKTYVEGDVKVPTNWSSIATAVTANPVASAFMYKR
jgi:hypothetical protein